jgi:hypothetical protein
MQAVCETRLRAPTTPRKRDLSASFVRICTPPGELPPHRRKRLKAESSARSRALCRLQPKKHTKYLEAERERKRNSAKLPCDQRQAVQGAAES